MGDQTYPVLRWRQDGVKGSYYLGRQYRDRIDSLRRSARPLTLGDDHHDQTGTD